MSKELDWDNYTGYGVPKVTKELIMIKEWENVNDGSLSVIEFIAKMHVKQIDPNEFLEEQGYEIDSRKPNWGESTR